MVTFSTPRKVSFMKTEPAERENDCGESLRTEHVVCEKVLNQNKTDLSGAGACLVVFVYIFSIGTNCA